MAARPLRMARNVYTIAPAMTKRTPDVNSGGIVSSATRIPR